jgi:hypothetical protein
MPVPVTVRFDEVPKLKAEPPASDVVHVPEPNAIVRANELAALMPPLKRYVVSVCVKSAACCK